MMRTNIARVINFAILSIVLPCVYGCIPGAAAFLGNSGGAGAASGGTLLASGGGAAIATIHNPEPATMLLMGAGMMAMAYYKKQ